MTNKISHTGNDIDITYNDEGQMEIKYYENGKLHNDYDLPAWETYYSNGQIKFKSWHKNGVLHRDGVLPAVLTYYESGKKMSMMWCVDGERSRENGLPAYVEYYENGQEKDQIWYINNNIIILVGIMIFL